MLALRRTTPADHDALKALVGEESVARWGWRELDEQDLASGLTVVVDGAVAGLVLFTEESDPYSRHVAFDIFLGGAFQGRGHGVEALRQAVARFAARGHHRFTIDPAVANERAIRCYERAGFRTVGVMRAYERGRDGTWHDNLLMELVVDQNV